GRRRRAAEDRAQRGGRVRQVHQPAGARGGTAPLFLLQGVSLPAAGRSLGSRAPRAPRWSRFPSPGSVVEWNVGVGGRPAPAACVGLSGWGSVYGTCMVTGAEGVQPEFISGW